MSKNKFGMAAFVALIAASGTTLAQESAFHGNPNVDVMTSWDSIKPAPAPVLKHVKIDPAKTALIMMDFDKKSCTPEKRARCAAMLPKIEAVLAKAREKQMLVVHFYNANMSRDDIVPSLAPKGSETATQKSGDKFYGSDLEKTLRARSIDTVILVGTSANGAVLSTAMGAYQNKFKAIVPVDTMPADTAWAEQFSIWEIANGPGFREVSTVTRSDMLEY
jgi:nicotinamidase-related amidase